MLDRPHLSARQLASAVVIALAGTVGAAGAAEPLTEHTLTAAPGETSPPATLDEMAWFVGQWTTEALGGTVDEVWSAPIGGAMVGLFRLAQDGRPVFYELMTLNEEDGSLLLRVKHFHADLRGWEEKDDTVDFRYLGTVDGVVHFDGLAFRPEGPGAATVYLAFRRPGESAREEVFRYRRVVPGDR